jgi:hypothetical protein
MVHSENDVVKKPANRSRLRLGFWGPVIVGAFALAWMVSFLGPSNSELEKYVTPPLDARGTRIELLKPRGWQAVIWDSKSTVWNEQKGGLKLFALQEPNTFGRFPSWLEDILPVGKPEWGSLVINVFPSNRKSTLFAKSNIEIVTSDPGGHGRTNWNSTVHEVHLNNTYKMSNSYNRSNRRLFDATHSAVLKSIRLYAAPSQLAGAATK